MSWLRLQRASPENPSTSLSNPAQWLGDAWGATTSHAGVSVSETTALNYHAWFACVEIKSNSVGILPLLIYLMNATGGRDRVTDHPVYSLLHRRPNPFQTPFAFKKMLGSSLANSGNAYGEIGFDNELQPESLWPLPPAVTRVEKLKGLGKFVVTQLPPDSKPPAGVAVIAGEAWLPAWRSFHIAGLSTDGFQGLSPVKKGHESIGLGMAAEQSGAAFYGSGMQPSVVFQHPGGMSAPFSEEAFGRLQKSLQTQAGGLDRAHRSLILEEGMTAKFMSLDPNVAQALETRQNQVRAIANYHSVPVNMLGLQDSSSYNSDEMAAIRFVQQCIQPFTTNIEQELTNALLGVDSDMFAEFLLAALLRGDSAARSEFFNKLFQVGAMSPNDIRQAENMNPVDGGDQRFVPMNMIPIDQAGIEPTEPQPGPPSEPPTEASRRELRARRSVAGRQRLRAAQRTLLLRAAQHFVGAEARAALRILNRALKSETPVADLLRELEAFYEKFPAAIRREFLPVIEAYAVLMAEAVEGEVGELGADSDVRMQAMAGQYADQFSDRYIGKSLAQIRDKAALEDYGTELGDLFGHWKESKAGIVASDEAVRAGGALAKTAYILAGVTLLRWVTVGKNCPFCDAMSGRVVGVEKHFVNRGENVDGAGGERFESKRDVGHEPLHQGCDCVVVAEFGGIG